MGIQCLNPYWCVDLNTYTCSNHFIYNVDGWAIHNAFIIGDHSSGSVIECMANLTYWLNNTVSASQLITAWQPPIEDFTEHNLEWFLLGDCDELLVKDFVYLSHTFMHCVSQNGSGPRVTGILTMCDASVRMFPF